jgi:hypothetical protein
MTQDEEEGVVVAAGASRWLEDTQLGETGIQL